MARAVSKIHVNAPVDRVYQMWTDFESFPTFMESVKQVKKVGEKRYHWKVDIIGQKLDFDAEVTEMTPGQRVSWKSVSGVQNQGSVAFQPEDAGTQVEAMIEYNPPQGVVAQASGLFPGAIGTMLEQSLDKDLRNFKKKAEQKAPPASGAGGASLTS